MVMMLRFVAVLAFGFSGAVLIPARPAFAQASVASVNGEPITSRDVEQRMRVSSMLFRQPLSRPAAIQELIDDRVKINEGRRIGMRATPAHMDEMISRMASSNKQNSAQFEQNLVKAGIDVEAVKAKINAQAIWGELLRVRGRSGNISNAELNAELERRVAKGDAKITDYVVRQVVFVVPPGTNPGQRERDANGVRGRFTDCETGVELVRTLRDVAVKERIGRTSTELSKQLSDLLAKTPVGRLTPPYRTEQGVEMLAVCEKSDRQDQTVLRNQIEQEMQQKRTQGTEGSYLAELKAKTDIRR
jgi:peptidyl-prolyl cis-trans isomerase SurA